MTVTTTVSQVEVISNPAAYLDHERPESASGRDDEHDVSVQTECQSSQEDDEENDDGD